jgi:hypothetical protein
MPLTSTALAAIIVSQPGQWTTHHQWTDDTGPAAREHAIVLQHDDDIILIAGSGYNPQLAPLRDAWRFDTDTNTWSQLELAGGLTAFGSARPAKLDDDTWIIFGGYSEGFACHNTLSTLTIDDDTITIEPLDQTNPPSERALHAFARDPKTGTLVTFGGVSQQGMRDGTWIARPNDDNTYEWTQLDTETSPSPRFGMSFGFDESTGHLIIASGQDSATSMSMSNEVWTLDLRADPPTWTNSATLPDTNAVRNPCFTWDQPRNTLWTWCGTPDGRTNAPDLIAITHTDNSTEIDTIKRDNEPQRRSSGSAVVIDTQIWFGLGNHAQGTMQDWVIFDPDTQTD